MPWFAPPRQGGGLRTHLRCSRSVATRTGDSWSRPARHCVRTSFARAGLASPGVRICAKPACPGYGRVMYSRPPRDERLRERDPAREPELTPPHRLLALQRSAGNAAVARALSSAPARTIARTEVNWVEKDIL